MGQPVFLLQEVVETKKNPRVRHKMMLRYDFFILLNYLIYRQNKRKTLEIQFRIHE